MGRMRPFRSEVNKHGCRVNDYAFVYHPTSALNMVDASCLLRTERPIV